MKPSRPDSRPFSRRDFLRATTAAALIPATSRLFAQQGGLPRRPIPSTGEELPIIGLGTSDEFDRVPAGGLDPLKGVVQALVDAGGTLIDTAPAYGNSESILGDVIGEMGLAEDLFMASKVSTRGQQSGMDSLARSNDYLGKDPMDLMQVHSLRDVDTQLGNLREWKAAGRTRYIGVTVSRNGLYGELERVMQEYDDMDFVQVNYSVLESSAEERLLPMAQDLGFAVLVNRPFGDGGYFSRVGRMPLPDWAAEFDCESWAQFSLKFIISHPAVTAAIPATSDPEHAVDNMRAGLGRLPDEATRARMKEFIRQI